MTLRRHFLIAVAAAASGVVAGPALAAPPGALGKWTTADLQAVLGERMK